MDEGYDVTCLLVEFMLVAQTEDGTRKRKQRNIKEITDQGPWGKGHSGKHMVYHDDMDAYEKRNAAISISLKNTV